LRNIQRKNLKLQVPTLMSKSLELLKIIEEKIFLASNHLILLFLLFILKSLILKILFSIFWLKLNLFLKLKVMKLLMKCSKNIIKFINVSKKLLIRNYNREVKQFRRYLRIFIFKKIISYLPMIL